LSYDGSTIWSPYFIAMGNLCRGSGLPVSSNQLVCSHSRIRDTHMAMATQIKLEQRENIVSFFDNIWAMSNNYFVFQLCIGLFYRSFPSAIGIHYCNHCRFDVSVTTH